jgi:hypothetical protein
VVLTNKLGDFRRLYSYVGGKLSPLGDDIKFDVARFDVDRRRTRIVCTTTENATGRSVPARKAHRQERRVVVARMARCHVLAPAGSTSDAARYGRCTNGRRWVRLHSPR